MPHSLNLAIRAVRQIPVQHRNDQVFFMRQRSWTDSDTHSGKNQRRTAARIGSWFELPEARNLTLRPADECCNAVKIQTSEKFN